MRYTILLVFLLISLPLLCQQRERGKYTITEYSVVNKFDDGTIYKTDIITEYDWCPICPDSLRLTNKRAFIRVRIDNKELIPLYMYYREDTLNIVLDSVFFAMVGGFENITINGLKFISPPNSRTWDSFFNMPLPPPSVPLGNIRTNNMDTNYYYNGPIKEVTPPSKKLLKRVKYLRKRNNLQ